ncbi:MAG TPA: DNA-directed RNA polymerase subunit beta' [Defluviitoga sp.]|nr:DNA-directed RNA polymerase subunit beta' [Defluviitoga sp.]HOP24626.1 DNA-directed RNA polymerase subunit beta' [Defluviitoga sp.]HPZ28871.1 DNA-directed RNA polymerase subunit beta' [Defluviitoga sp.]HQD62636.1 DNA-directed RNA polymerase subunit beta' [Defluviitoga sp.]
MANVSSFQRKIAKIKIGVASPETILANSNGEVIKPETLNHRTGKPEKDGLFCEKIFGPTKDYECACGKYKGKKYEGTVCERCGVKVESKEARRRKMGHLALATPVSHIWYLKSSPSVLSILLNISVKDLENIIYYGSKRVVERAYLILASSQNDALGYFPGEILYQKEFEIYSQYLNLHVEPAVKTSSVKGLPVADISGKVDIKTELTETDRELSWIIIRDETGIERRYPIFEGASIMVEQGQHVEKGTPLADRFLYEDDYLTQKEYSLFMEHYPGSIEVERDIERDTPIVVITDIDKRFSKRIGKKTGDILLEDEARAYEEVMKILNSKIKEERERVINKTLTEDITFPEKKFAKGLKITQDVLNQLLEFGVKDVLAKDEEDNERIYQINKYEKFEAGYGAEAVQKLLKKLDLELLKAKLESELEKLDKKSQKALKILRRLKLVNDFINSGNKPEWLITSLIPIIPPDLRPLIQIEGGRFAATDLNDLYRKVINRNNRLKRLLEMDAPEIIIRNEKRILQQAVDSLIYNGRVGKPMTDRNRRPLRSLTDLLKGKKGRFRRNLLGKRVDYSGRAVIAVGPDLKLHECGLPKKMALELFKPFVLAELLKGSNAASKSARKFKKTIIEKEMPEAWEVLEEVIKGHPVLLNRAPTLHRISIQAFIPKLIEGNAIRLHPLVCPPFNADFDGDQMAVHIPLSNIAQAESKFLMLSRYNIISPANGKPISMPGKDIIAGTYYLTMHEDDKFENTKLPKSPQDMGNDSFVRYVFSDNLEAIYAYEYFKIIDSDIHLQGDHLEWKKSDFSLHEPIGYKDKKGNLVKTTVGKVIFNEAVEEDLIDYSKKMDKKELKNLIFATFEKYGIDKTADLLDDIKDFGFHYATLSGLTISIRDVLLSPKREEIIEEAKKSVLEIESLYEEGYLNDNERYKEIIQIWENATNKVTEETANTFRKYPFNPIWMMIESGARGNIDQLKQLAGMRGLMADPSGKIIEVPITSNFKNGLSELEFFTSTHGSRKGSADTALRTSTAGYLTRRLVDVAQSITITEEDCGTDKGVEAKELWSDGSKIENLSDFLFGRILVRDVLDPETGKIIFNKDTGKKYEKDLMLKEGDAKFLANYTKEIPIYVDRKLNMENIPNNIYCESLEDVVIDNKVLIKKGEEVTEIVTKELLLHGIKSLNVKEYKSVDFVHVGEDLKVNIDGRPTTLLKYQERIDIKTAKLLEKHGVAKVRVRPLIFIRSPLTCEAEEGICAKCYGMDLSNYRLVNIGEAVGVIAAQSIGEPGTQLTMRTFHTGGIATTQDITQGLPRAEELFEARKKTKGPEGIFAKSKGIVKAIERDEENKKGKKLRIIVETPDGELDIYEADYKTKAAVEVGDKVLPAQRLTTGNIKPRKILKDLGVDELSNHLLSEIKKIYAEQGVDIHDKHFEIIIRQMINKVEVIDGGDTHYMPGDLVPYNRVIKINEEILNENALVPENREIVLGKKLAKKVIIASENDDEESKVYEQGTNITEEVIKDIIEAGIKEIEIYEEYKEIKAEDGTTHIVGTPKKYLINAKNTIKFERRLLRITKASLEREGWLSAASFQQTVQVLTEAAIEGRVDKLKGLKENVIVGQPIPAGTGLSLYTNLNYEIAQPEKEAEVAAGREKSVG